MGRFGTEDVPIKEILFAYQSTLKSELMDKSPGPRPLKKFWQYSTKGTALENFRVDYSFEPADTKYTLN